MTHIEAFNIIEAFREELESAVKHDLYVTLDTGSCEELLEAFKNYDTVISKKSLNSLYGVMLTNSIYHDTDSVKISEENNAVVEDNDD